MKMTWLSLALVALLMELIPGAVQGGGEKMILLPESCTTVRGATGTPPSPPIFVVSTTGNDSNPGTLQLPWKTIQKAANTVFPGSIVQVRGGVYNEHVTVNTSGSATGGYIKFQNYPGEVPTLDGTGLKVPDAATGMFLLTNKSYIVIKGFEIRNYRTSSATRTPAGIFVEGAGNHIELRNNRIHHIETNYGGTDDGNAHGIAIYGTAAPQSINNIIVDGNELYSLKLGFSESLVVNGNVEIFSLTNNVIHDNNNIGIDVIGFEGVAPDPAYDQARNGLVRGNRVYAITSYDNPVYQKEHSAGGIYVDGGKQTIIERNTVYAADIGIELASEHTGRATSSITVRNNVVYRNQVAGISLGGYDTDRGSTEDCVIVNNTLFFNDTLKTGTGEISIQFDVRNTTIKNNIIYANAQGLLISNDYTQNTGSAVNSNIYFVPGGATPAWQWKTMKYSDLATYRGATGNDTGSEMVNPQLVDEVEPDLHLRDTSPAIDAGENLALAGMVDIDGQPRIEGNRIDIGADERTSGVIDRVPVLSSLNPAAVEAGTGPITLTLTGKNFAAGMLMNWNDVSHTTTVLSSTSALVALGTADLASAGTVSVTLVVGGPGGGESAPVIFTILPRQRRVFLPTVMSGARAPGLAPPASVSHME